MENENQKKGSVTRSSGAESHFPINKVERLLRERNLTKRLRTSAPVFLVGVLEYLTSNILDLAGKEAHTSGNKFIDDEHVMKAILKNNELYQLFKNNEYLVGQTPEPTEIPAPSETSAPKEQ